MNKQMNKSIIPQGYVARPPKAAQTLLPQSIQDMPRPRPVATAATAHEEIAKRAYQIYVEKGRPQGQSDQHWLQAEQEKRDRDVATLLSR